MDRPLPNPFPRFSAWVDARRRAALANATTNPPAPVHNTKTPIAFLYTTSPTVLHDALASLEASVPNLPYRPEANTTGEGWVRQPAGELHYLIRLNGAEAGNGDGGMGMVEGVQKFTAEQKEVQAELRARRFAERQARQEQATGEGGVEGRGVKRGREEEEEEEEEEGEHHGGGSGESSSDHSSSKRQKPNERPRMSTSEVEDLMETTTEWVTDSDYFNGPASPPDPNLVFPDYIEFIDIGEPENPVSISSSSAPSLTSSNASTISISGRAGLARLTEIAVRDANPQGLELWTNPTRDRVEIDGRYARREWVETSWLDRVEDERDVEGARPWLDRCMQYFVDIN